MTAQDPHNDATCGDFGGRTSRGEPCAKPAGWGADADTGPCTYHRPESPTRFRDVPDAPAHLTVEAQQLWNRIMAVWPIGPDRELLLRGALEAWTRYREAVETLRREGDVVENPDSGNLRKHPAAAIANSAYREFRLSLKQLALQPQDPEAFHDEN